MTGVRAFAAAGRRQTLTGAAKAIWWGAAATAARWLARPERWRPAALVSAPPPPAGFVREAWRAVFAKDAADVAAGLYPAMETRPDPLRGLLRSGDLLLDAPRTDARRRDRRGRPVEAPSAAYPAYYRQAFHDQAGGWLTEESARRYEAQVETLFAGAAGPMRRRALSLLARAWRERDQRGLAILDLACGSGAFLEDLARAFPRARLIGLDLSPPYLAQAARRKAASLLVQGLAERLPFADGAFDAVTCVYLFHELPSAARGKIAAEIARVLAPGAHLAFADALQAADEPRLARLIEAFPAYFHEPYFASYQKADLISLFGRHGMALESKDQAFLTKALLFARNGQEAKSSP